MHQAFGCFACQSDLCSVLRRSSEQCGYTSSFTLLPNPALSAIDECLYGVWALESEPVDPRL